jgi:hypothetical protein
MSRNPAEDVLNELLPYFEAIDTQNAAIVQFLKDKRVVSDEQLAPYLERAAKASNVRWLAARLRMGRLFSVPETENEAAAEKPDKGQKRTAQPSTDGGKPPEERERGETAEKKSEVNTNSSEDETADSPEASERKTKSSSSEHAGPEKDAKSAPERSAGANKDAA